jgi:hypothetical protein
MPTYTVMIPATTAGATRSSPPYPTIEDAPRGAKLMLANGAASAWVVDGRDSLFLRAEQVRTRLASSGESNGSAVQPQMSTDHAGPLSDS